METIVRNNVKRGAENDENAQVCAKTQSCLYHTQNFSVRKRGNIPYILSQEIIVILVEILFILIKIQ